MEQRDNMHNGKLYDPNDDSVMEEQMVCLDRLYDFNQTRPAEMDKRNAIMKEMMGDVGKDCYIEPPFHANWGGKHVHFGDGVYANFGLTCVDDTHIYVGSHTLFGPNVVLATAGHPMMPECANMASSTICRSISGRIAGWEPELSLCRVLRSGTMS